jgi:pimeloyl-ACP methyl ester carboxylesterase
MKTKTGIHFRDEGKGPVIVLLHGFLGSLDIWNEFTEALVQDFRIVRIDLPGHGETGNFSENHSMGFMAERVKEVMDQLGIRESVIIGHSMGGFVALAYASRHPGSVKGLGLFHSHAAADNEEAKMNRTRTIQIIEQDNAGFIMKFIPDLFAVENIRVFDHQIRWLKQIASKTTMNGIIASLRGMKEREDQRELLKSAQFPVLFIIGKQDKRIPAEVIMPQLSLPAHAETLILSQVGHMGFVEASTQTLEMIRSFCKRIYL